jgi:hypothetical protein
MLSVLANVRDITEQARRLIRLAELAYGARNYDGLRDLTAALACLSYQPARDAATYYRAVLMKRAGHLDAAQDLLEGLHTPRAIQTLAAVHENKGRWDEAARLHIEAMHQAKGVDAFAFVCAAMQVAVRQSLDGDHHRALNSFEALWPVVRVVAKSQPYVYPAWCNGRAVELAELGRIEEARAASAVAIASPIVEAYPEWRATAAEMAEQQPAKMIFVVSIPTAAPDAEERPRHRIQSEKPQPVRLPCAPPSPITAHLLTCAPIHAPPFRF